MFEDEKQELEFQRDKLEEFLRLSEDVREKEKKVKEFLKAEEEFKEDKNKSTFLNMLNKIPSWNRVFTVTILVFAGILVFKHAPVLTAWLVEEYDILPGTILKLFSITWIGFLLLFTIDLLLFWRVGGWIMPPLLSQMRGTPVLDMYSTARSRKFVVPKKNATEKPVWKIEKFRSFIPRDEDTYIGPNNTRMIPCTPEHGQSFNPREMLLKNKLDNIDMTIIDENAELAKEEARREMSNPLSNMKSWIGPLIFIVVIGLIMSIPLMKYLDNNNAGKTYMQRYEQERELNQRLAQQVIKLGGDPLQIEDIQPKVNLNTKKDEKIEFPGTGMIMK